MVMLRNVTKHKAIGTIFQQQATADFLELGTGAVMDLFEQIEAMSLELRMGRTLPRHQSKSNWQSHVWSAMESLPRASNFRWLPSHSAQCTWKRTARKIGPESWLAIAIIFPRIPCFFCCLPFQAHQKQQVEETAEEASCCIQRLRLHIASRRPHATLILRSWWVIWKAE